MRKVGSVYATAWKRAGGWLLSSVLGLALSLQAEQLPIKIYTTADGLARDDIHRIVRDGRGYLWFCTDEGLSRFDGYQFTTYTVKEGLPHGRVLDLLATRDGQYWVATADGVCRFNPAAVAAAHRFEVYRPEGADTRARAVRRLLEDRAGTIWCGTADGLFRLQADRGHWTLAPVDLGLSPEPGQFFDIRALLEDRRGDLWIGTARGLFRRRPDGRLEHYTERHGLKGLFDLTELVEDHAGRLWLATRWNGLHRLVREPAPDRAIVEQTYRIPDAPLPDTFLSLFAAADGRLWAGRHQELVEILPADDPHQTTFRRYTAENGLVGIDIWALNEDRDGNLWLGSEARGVAKIIRQGFTLYTETDGLLPSHIPNRSDDLYVSVFRDLDNHFIGQFNGRKFVWSRERWPGRQYWWGFTLALQDHTGEWWIPTTGGLLRLPATTDLAQLVRAAPRATYTVRDGLASDVIFGLHEDARGDLWIAHTGNPSGLTHWTRADGRFHRYSLTEETPFLKDNFINAFGEDRAGKIWMGLRYGGLVRHRAGRFTTFTEKDGVPAGTITAVYRDGAGRLWIASTSGGVARLDDPATERPRFVTYSRANGLASDSVNAITEDRWGRIYLATGRGINRIDPATGRIKQYTTADGLPENTIERAFRDGQDTLWFVTRRGLARLVPEPDRPAVPPSVWISGVRVAGVPWPVADVGQAAVTGIVVSSNQNQFRIDFVGLHFAPGEALRYEYQLEGARPDWQATDQRTIFFSHLAPGAYQFRVRAVSTDGSVSPSPATVSFTIRPPLWRQGWFLVATGLLTAALLYALYRYRVARLLEIERVRTRIATDLHDDIGSYLSGMALLSDAARRGLVQAAPGTPEMLDEISSTARNLADAMSDIVWSIDPRRDDLRNLLVRVRQYAARVFAAQGIAYTIQAPADEELKLTAEQRRHLYLIYKEAITNVVRHAGATSVTIAIKHEHRHLTAIIQDNGRGFAGPTDGVAAGNGLRNMQARAEHLGGRLSIQSTPDHGTSMTLTVPLV